MTEFVWIAVASGDYWFDRLRADAGEKPINADGLWGGGVVSAVEYVDEFMDERVRVSRMPVLT
jgi:hypothetical protein